jgi:hypothetical protein
LKKKRLTRAANDKQNIFETSPAPLYALIAELKPLEERLSTIRWDTGNADLDVSNDVFERINSGGVMGLVGNDGVMSIDLHALHVGEAKIVLSEYVSH